MHPLIIWLLLKRQGRQIPLFERVENPIYAPPTATFVGKGDNT